MINWNEYDKHLGTVPDSCLAEEMDCTAQYVGMRRNSLGIKPYSQKRYDWTKYEHLLGTMADHRLAAVIGCTRDSVTKRRTNLGIDCYKKAVNI